jgi:hypothetical protein
MTILRSPFNALSFSIKAWNVVFAVCVRGFRLAKQLARSNFLSTILIPTNSPYSNEDNLVREAKTTSTVRSSTADSSATSPTSARCFWEREIELATLFKLFR